METGVLAAEGIAADLYDLTRGDHPGRTSAEQITLFKSVGAALEDLAAAILAYESSPVSRPRGLLERAGETHR